MRFVRARNLHSAIPLVLQATHKREDSGPLVMEIDRPDEPVVFWPQLNIDPFEVFKGAVSLLASMQDPTLEGWSNLAISRDRGVLDVTSFEVNGRVEEVITPWLMAQQWWATAHKVPLGKFFRVLSPPMASVQAMRMCVDATPDQLKDADPYEKQIVTSNSIPIGRGEHWRQEIEMLNKESDVNLIGYTDRWIRRVACPIFTAHCTWRTGEGDKKAKAEAAMEDLRHCDAKDWQFACDQWLVKQHETQTK